MVIFLINIAMILLWPVVLEGVNAQQAKKKYCVLCTMQIILLLALRGENVGNDTSNYLAFFDNVSINPWYLIQSHKFEVGFKYFVKGITLITDNRRFFMIITATVTTIPIGIFIYRNSKLPLISFLMFSTMEFLLFHFTGLRQTLAFVFVLKSYEYLQKNTFFKFLLWIFIAASFHKTALVFLIAYPIKQIKVKRLYLYSGGLILAVTCKKQIMDMLVKYFFQDYILLETSAYTRIFIGLLTLGVLVIFNRRRVLNENEKILMDMLFLANIFFVLAIANSAAARAGRYFFFFIIILIPEFIMSFSRKEERVIMFMLICLISIILMLYLFPRNGLVKLPYELMDISFR